MAITTYRLAELHKEYNGHWIIKNLLIESISPREQKIYTMFIGEKTLTAVEIAKKFKMSTNSVDNMLSRIGRIRAAMRIQSDRAYEEMVAPH